MDSTQVTYDGEEVTVTQQGVITITEADGDVTVLTVTEAIAMARTRRSRGIQVGNFNTQNNTFKG